MTNVNIPLYPQRIVCLTEETTEHAVGVPLDSKLMPREKLDRDLARHLT